MDFIYVKFSDDIPIQAEESADATPLGSISEEQEEKRTRSGSSALKHLPKLPGLGKKPKASKSSPTPQRNSLEVELPIEMHMTGAGGGGEQVSLVSGVFGDGQEDGVAAHPVTVV